MADLLNIALDAADLVSNAISAERDFSRSITDAAIIPHIPNPRPDTRTDADERLDQLLHLCSAMWQLLKEKTNLTEDDLINRVALLDAQDGVADGKLTPTPKPCPKCHRIVAARQSRCMYCGFQLPIDNLFKTI